MNINERIEFHRAKMIAGDKTHIATYRDLVDRQWEEVTSGMSDGEYSEHCDQQRREWMNRHIARLLELSLRNENLT